MTNTPPMTPSELLTAAADWIDSHGWLQGNFYDADGRTCAIGALHFASRNGGYGRDGQAAHEAITEAAGSLAQIAEDLSGKAIDGATAQEKTIHWNNSGVIDRADAVVWLQKASAHAAEAGR
ncbi:hypothetical protein HZU40_21100 [Mycolicibacterium fluoranthenivorans]|uniref:Uncharacterized protein n=1 Tax=Mycolicibacterium fluoranthenivorans TaxID=258505 RepID=A0A7G8P8S3_9MYCO|nr:hypothetical protein [Mycolicibacterium fluoranthenivorans]QNJ90739.1 hypothetical protein HZU40_21100 [Mycolicibacterium fluoranthenivorans]